MSIVGKNEQAGAPKWVYQASHFSAPKLADFCIIYLGLDWPILKLILTIQLFQPFWNLIVTRFKIIL